MSRLILLLILVSLAYSEPPAPRNNLDDHPAALPEASQDKSSDSQSLNLGENKT